MTHLESLFILVCWWCGGDVATLHVVYDKKKKMKAQDVMQHISSPLPSPIIVIDSIHSHHLLLNTP